MGQTTINLVIAFSVALPSVAALVAVYVSDKGMRTPPNPNNFFEE